jgi:hypothetical protein
MFVCLFVFVFVFVLFLFLFLLVFLLLFFLCFFNLFSFPLLPANHVAIVTRIKARGDVPVLSKNPDF